MKTILLFLLVAFVSLAQTTFNNVAVNTNATVAGADVATKVQNISALVALAPKKDGQIVETLGYYSAGDGGGARFYYSASSTESTNSGTVIKPSVNGRFIWIQDATIRAEMFGATKNDGTDDSAAIQGAINYAQSSGVKIVELGGGTFIAQGLQITNCTLRGAGFSKSANDSKTTLSPPVGSTSKYLLLVGPENLLGVTIEGITFVGYKERDIYNLKSITGVTSRTVFNVNPSDVPDTVDSGVWPNFGFAFFYSPNENRYVGIGQIVGVNPSTGQITLGTGYDWYAAPSPGGNLSTSFKVSFSKRATNTFEAYAGGDTVAYNDHTAPGMTGIRVTGNNVVLKDVHVFGFHTGVESLGNATLSFSGETWLENAAFAGYANLIPQYANVDNSWDRLFVQGIYYTDISNQAETNTLHDKSWRNTAFGIFNPPSVSVFKEVNVARTVVGIVDLQGGGRSWGKVFIDVPVKIGELNFRSSTASPLDIYDSLIFRAFGNWSTSLDRQQPSNLGNYDAWVQASGSPPAITAVSQLAVSVSGAATTNNFTSTWRLFGTNSIISINTVRQHSGSSNWFQGSSGALRPIVSNGDNALTRAFDPYQLQRNSESITLVANSITNVTWDTNGMTVSGVSRFTAAPLLTKTDGSTLVTLERTSGSPANSTIDLSGAQLNVKLNSGLNSFSVNGPTATQGRFDIRPLNKLSSTGGDVAAITTINFSNTPVSLISLLTASGSDALTLGRGIGLPGPNIIEFYTTASPGTGSPVKRGTIDSGGGFEFGGGSGSAAGLLTLNSTTRGFRTPVMTTAQRDAISGVSAGIELYNSDINKKSIWNNTRWVNQSQEFATVSTNWVIPSLTALSPVTLTISVTGSQVGDQCLVSPSVLNAGNTIVSGVVTSSGTVTIYANALVTTGSSQTNTVYVKVISQ